MKQVLRRGFKEIIVDEVPDPMIVPHHVLVRPHYSLISPGTETASIYSEGVLKQVADHPSHLQMVWDVMKANGPIATAREVLARFRDYAVLGYSGAGVVVERHHTVTDLEIGDRVAYGGEGTGHGETILTGRNLVAKVPENVPFEHACFATLGSIAMNAVRIGEIGLGDSVVVVGLGLVGQLIAQLARLQGGVVIATDLKPERVDLAKQTGAPYAISGGASLRDQVSAITNGRGADRVFIAAAAKSSGPCRAGLEVCRDRGRIVVVGAVEMNFPWEEMYRKEIQLFMSRAYGPGSYDPAYEKRGQDYPFSYVRWTENRNMEEFLRLISAGAVCLELLISHRFVLEEAPKAYETILDPAINSLAVLLRYPAMESSQEYRPVRTVAAVPQEGAKAETLGVALVGSGNLARWAHLPNLQKIPGVALRAVHSASGARGKSYAVRFRAAYCTSDLDHILSDPEVGVMLIVSRNQHHAPQALAALRAGKHVFVEKPMALTEQECRDLVLASQESGKQLTVGFNRRFAPYYKPFREHLKQRSHPAVVNCRVNSPSISGEYWMADPTIGGAILGEACHFVDLMQWMLGADPVSVSAYSLPTGKNDPIGENNLVASFRFADGSIGNLTYCIVGSKASGGERVEAFAQGIGISSEDFKELTIKGAKRTRSTKLFADKGYFEQLAAFVDCVRTGKAPDVTARDGALATIACLKMLEAARTGKAVAINVDFA
jgi:predicted dehydrogenase/threonine dehydrogenase-like Zn-dependent dehydrogenase